MGWSIVGSAGTVVNGNSPVSAPTGQASTASNLLICCVTVTQNSGAPTMPSGWVLRSSKVSTTTPYAAAYIYEYVDCPSGVTSVSISTPGGHIAAQVIEYTHDSITGATADQTGGASGAISSSLAIATSGHLTGDDELAVSCTALIFSTATSTTLSAGTDFTRQGAWNNGSSQGGHASFDNNLDTGASAGATVTDTVGNSTTGSGNMAGVIATYYIVYTATAPLSLGTNATSTATATAPLALATATSNTSSARGSSGNHEILDEGSAVLADEAGDALLDEGATACPLAVLTAVSATHSARSGTATAPLTLGVAASTVVQAPLSLSATAAGVSSSRSGTAPAQLLGLAVAAASASPQRFGGAVPAFLLLLTPRYPLHLGGQVTEAEYDGTLTLTAAHWAYDGTAVLASYDGTAVLLTSDGTLDEWTMTPINITLAEFNDEQLSVTITSGGSAVNLTGYEVDAFFKAKAGVADDDPSTIKLSTTGGSPAITITNAALGQCLIDIAASDLQSASITFYRIDAVDTGGKRNTAIYGTVVVTLL